MLSINVPVWLTRLVWLVRLARLARLTQAAQGYRGMESDALFHHGGVLVSPTELVTIAAMCDDGR